MHPTSLKIISLNIEHDQNIDRVLPFLIEQQADVILLQEMSDKYIGRFEEALGMKSVFSVQCYLLNPGREKFKLGVITLSALPITKSYNLYYRGNDADLVTITPGNPEKQARSLLITEVVKNGQSYCIGNTHFTWSPGGQANANQRQDITRLLQSLSNIPEFVLCGDFNAPRGREIFDTIALKYKDNIPAEITSTIDKNLHKAGDLNIVVDGLFTTPIYQVTHVKIIDGLSDHCAILATISKKDNVTIYRNVN